MFLKEVVAVGDGGVGGDGRINVKSGDSNSSHSSSSGINGHSQRIGAGAGSSYTR